MEEGEEVESIRNNEISTRFLRNVQSNLVKKVKKRRSSLQMTRETLRAKSTLESLSSVTRLDRDLKCMDEMSVNEQIDLYREQMKDIAMMKQTLDNLKTEDEERKKEEEKKRPDETEKRRWTQKIVLVYCMFRVMQLKFSLKDQIQLFALIHQAVRGDCCKGMVAWPLPSYLNLRRKRSTYVKTLLEVATVSTNTPNDMMNKLKELGETEASETFLTTHRSMSRRMILNKWKSFGGMKFVRIASRLVCRYEDMHPKFKSFMSENSEQDTWEASISRMAMDADLFDMEKIQEEREIYFGNDMFGGVKDALIVSTGVAGQLAMKSRKKLGNAGHKLVHYDISKTTLGKTFGQFYNSKRVVSFRYRINKMRRRATRGKEKSDDNTAQIRRRTRWTFKMKWKLSSKFRGNVIRLQCVLRRLIAQHELNRLRAEKRRLDKLINRIISRWRFWTFMARMRRIVQKKHKSSIVINRQCRVRLARNWRKRRWKEMHRAATIVQSGIRRFIQRVPYVVSAIVPEYQDANGFFL